VPALASSADAAHAFGELRRRWAVATRADRKGLRDYIGQLRDRYEGEQVARQADLYLAWIALEFGDFEEAQRLAAQAGAPHPGNVRMLGQLIEGASLSRSGEPEEALKRLMPLVGQLIDVYARDLLHEEAVISAITAHRWPDALWLLDVWLRDVPEDEQQTVLDIVRALVKEIPDDPIEQTLRRHLSVSDQQAGALDKALVRQLGATALRAQDSALARRLLDLPRVLPLLGEDAAALLELAARFDVPQVNGRQVGLYLADERPELAERSAQISLGALDALPGDSSPRLVVRQAPTEAAPRSLAALDAEGVSVLVGGTDPDSAERLARFSESEGIAALLLVPPSSSTAHRWAFLFGPDEQQPAASLLAALARQGAQHVAVVGASPSLSPPGSMRLLPATPCAAMQAPGQLTRYPVHEWRTRGVDGLLLLGSARCAQDVIGEARAAGLPLRLALGPVASELVQPPPRGSSPTRRALSSGAFVGLGCYPSLQADAPAEGAPGFLRLLARDAVRVAAQALAGLPEDSTMDSAQVKHRRELVREALEAASSSSCLGLRPHRDLGAPPWRLTERRLRNPPGKV